MNPAFQDPSFETPTAAGWGTYNPTGSAWTFSGGPPDTFGGSYPLPSSNGSGVCTYPSSFLYSGSTYSIPDGNQVGFLQGVSTISQEVMFPAGTFSITFLAAQRTDGPYYTVLGVLLDGVSIGSAVLPYQFENAEVEFTTYTTDPFTVAAGPHTVMFSAPDAGDIHITALIDMVEINVINLDTPTTTFAKPLGFIPRRPAGRMPVQRMFGGNR